MSGDAGFPSVPVLSLGFSTWDPETGQIIASPKEATLNSSHGCGYTEIDLNFGF